MYWKVAYQAARDLAQDVAKRLRSQAVRVVPREGS